MRLKNTIAILLYWMIPFALHSQQLRILHSHPGISIRGLSAVDDTTVWVSGTNGAIGRSVDGGNHWTWMQVKGFEKTDFRDIEAFNAQTAVIMGIADPAYILKTNDGGRSWSVVFEDRRNGMFLDAMAFRDELNGIVVGDPVEGRFFIARTFNGGDTWQPLAVEDRPVAQQGEALFAASGTNIRPVSAEEVCFVTGGTTSRLIFSKQVFPIPLTQGKATTGANSVAVYFSARNKTVEKLVVVGGDFAADTLSSGNCAVSGDGGQTWQLPEAPPKGYRSCVEWLSENKLITCGTTGVDISTDGGIRWKTISAESFHVCRKSKHGKTVFLAGNNGRIAKLD